MASSYITTPYVLPRDWNATADYGSIPSEKDILQRDAFVPGYVIKDSDLSGLNTAALAYVAAHVLSISETPFVSFYKEGGYNMLFRIDFPNSGRTLVARIPFQNKRTLSRIECCVATMTFARYVRNIPTPAIFAWNASVDADNAVGAPYVLQEYIDNVIEPWQVWDTASEETRAQILEELARHHAAFLAPLHGSLNGVGELGFAPGLSSSDVSVLADPKSYVVRPLQLRLSRPFFASSTSLSELWDQLWLHQKALCTSDSGSPDLDELGLDDDDDEGCDTASFSRTSSQVRTLSHSALALLDKHPGYARPCMVHFDYAYRNVLLDPDTYAVKAFIDWDDVHVMPFVVGLDYPEDIKTFSAEGLALDSNFYTEGEFPSFPPDEHGEIDKAVQSEDVDEDDCGVMDRKERIRNTMSREGYIDALKRHDARVGEQEAWEVRRSVLKLHHLLNKGGRMWWRKREWLSQQTSSDLA